MIKRKINLFFAIITFFTLALTACSNNNSATKKSTTNQISVNYTLKEGKKTFDKKTVKVPKKAKVIAGLKRPGKLRKPKALSLQLTAKLKILRKRFIGPTQLTISLPLKALMNKLLITKIKLNLL